MDILQVTEQDFQIRVDLNLLNILKSHSIYQIRTSADRYPDELERWKVGNYLTLRKDCLIEPYVVNTAGYHLYTVGAFSDVASTLPVSFHLGRYVSIGKGLEFMGQRHPLEAAVMSSVSYDEARVTMRAFRADLKALGETFNFNAVPYPQPGDTQRTHIGHDVWIAQDVTLRNGVQVGNGAVIGAGAVVVKDVPPYAIVAGNPARIVRYRFEPEIIELLEASRWWEFHPGQLHEIGMADPEKFARSILDQRDSLKPFCPPVLDLWALANG